MKLTIKQNNTAEQVTSPLIDKLYLLSSGGTLTQNSTLEGVLSTQLAYEDAVSYLQEHYTGLTINALNYYIRFADPNVLSVLLNAGFGDGTGVTTQEAAATNLGTIFKDNKNIVSFSELRYFTTALKDGAFTRCSNLEEVDIYNRTMIPKEAFYQCSKLKKFSGHNSVEGELDLPNLLQIGGINPFEKCSQLTTIVSLGQVTSLPGSCFNTCTALDTVYQSVFDKLTTISASAFSKCPIEHIIQADGTDSSVLYLPNLVGYLGGSAFSGAKITDISSLGSVASIGNNAFENCTNLVTINFPSTLTSVGQNAFRNCSNLNAIYIDSLDDWLSIAFSYQPLAIAHNLYINGSLVQNVTIPLGTDLTNKFNGSTSLESVVIESGITSIGINAFNSCSSLTSVTIGNSVTSIGNSAFQNCSGLTSVAIPNAVTSIGISAFGGCKNLTHISIPDSVTTLNYDSFRNCDGLLTVEFGTGIQNIGATAFYNNWNIQYMIFHATTPPDINSNSPLGTAGQTFPIYVPDEYVNTYKQKENWSNLYAGRIKPMSEFPNS